MFKLRICGLITGADFFFAKGKIFQNALNGRFPTPDILSKSGKIKDYTKNTPYFFFFKHVMLNFFLNLTLVFGGL